MKQSLSISFIAIFVLLFLLGGCKKPGPIELETRQEPDGIEVQSVTQPEDTMEETDTTGLLGLERERFFGRIVVSGVRNNRTSGADSVSLAHVVFFDRSRPLMLNGRVLGYHSFDLGSVFIDGLPMYRVPLRLLRNVPGLGTIDTLLGFQYALRNVNGVGGRGFMYSPDHSYEWANVGPGTISFTIGARSARSLEILQPTPGQTISRRAGMTVRWQGGERILHLVISGRNTDNTIVPLLRLKLRGTRGNIFIPPKILQMIRLEYGPRLLLTFVSQTQTTATAVGFSDPILVHTASVQNIAVTIQR